MRPTLRILLIIVSVLVVLFVLRKIRRAQLNIDDSIYWIVSSLLVLILSIFPQIAEWASILLGIQSPANFVFLVMIFMVLMKLFYVSIDLSIQKHRLNHLVQNLALLDLQTRERAEKPKK